MHNFSIQFKAMGCHMQAWLSVDSLDDAQILNQVPVWFEEWEAALSRFRPTSELSQLNQQAGEWVSVSPLLYDLINDARQAADMTGGIFNPLILNALEAAGYDRSFDRAAFAGGCSWPRPTEPVLSWQALQLDAKRQAVFVPAGARVDLGGIAKGWAAQEACDRLSAYGPCMVDAGGDLAASGSPDESGGWLASVPAYNEETLYTFRLNNEAMATSGSDYRQWQRGGQTLHHLIDPQTGQPSESTVLRSTVIAPDATLAVVWAKVALLTQTFPDLPTVFIYKDGTVKANLEMAS